MMPLSEWKSGLAIWKNVKQQAEISIETAEAVIPVFEAKIKELEEKDEVKNGE